jgi:DNA-binding response OmpR family regulator
LACAVSDYVGLLIGIEQRFCRVFLIAGRYYWLCVELLTNRSRFNWWFSAKIEQVGTFDRCEVDMSIATILLVEDDANISSMIKEYLENNNFKVVVAADGEAALCLFASVKPRLVILDVLLPKITGTEVCRIIRKTSDVPIIMATALNDDIDRIVGLEIGADDYLSKPFHPRELLARVRNLLKRCYTGDAADGPRSKNSRLTLDREARVVEIDGAIVKLTPTEYKIIETLVANGNRALSRTQLANLVLGYAFDGCERTIDTHIKRIRGKFFEFDKQVDFIETVRGFGYKIAIDGIAKND